MSIKLTAEQILVIVEANYSVSNFAHGEWGELESDNGQLTDDQQTEYEKVKEEKGHYWDIEEKFILQNLGLGEVEEVAQHGGEGQGDNWYSVKYFKDHDVYIKTTGYYQSHNGTDFEEGYGEEVKPVEKTITVFE